MQTLKENDTVYTPYGYGTLVNLGNKQELKIPKKQGLLSVKIYVKEEQEQKIHQQDKIEEVQEKEQQVQQQEIIESAVDNKGEIQTIEKNNELQIANENKAVAEATDDLQIPIQENNEQQQVEQDGNKLIQNIVTVQLKWGGTVYLNETLISRCIRIHVKTFHGTRKNLTFDVDIMTSVQNLKNMVLDALPETAKTLYNLRLVYPMSSMKELNVNTQNILYYKIPNNAQLILLSQLTFTWDPQKKGNGIKLSGGNLTANKNGDVDYQTVLGTMPMNSGRHYWEIKIDKFVDEEDLFIGIARREVDLNVRPIDSKNFWGYMCLCGQKFGVDGNIHEYGYSAKVGDVIGVLLEFKSGLGTLSFYKNGTKCGVAYSSLSGSFYPAVSMYYGEVQVTLDPKATLPIS